MKNSNKEKAIELLKGGYDLHTHSSPSLVDRALDDFELIKEANEFDMAGVMIKSHYEPTHSRAHLVNLYSGVNTKAFGGIVLNWPVGGINPYAVENALYNDARMVWMPTMDAHSFMEYGKFSHDIFDRPGITLYDEGGKIKSEVYSVLEVAKKYDVYIASGHLGLDEAIDFCKLSRRMNVKTIMTHPDWERTLVPIGLQLEMVKLGVMVEKVWLNIGIGPTTAESMAAGIKMMGAENVFMVTDRGQVGYPHPAIEMVNFIERMLDNGISEAEIKTMVCINPRIVVGD